MFALTNDNKLIYAITPDILQPQYEDSILEFKPNLPELPVGFEEVDFNTEMQRYPAYDIYTDAMKLERDRAAERTFNRDMPRLNQYFKDAGLPMSKYYQSQESPFSNGGKSRSRLRHRLARHRKSKSCHYAGSHSSPTRWKHRTSTKPSDRASGTHSVEKTASCCNVSMCPAASSIAAAARPSPSRRWSA